MPTAAATDCEIGGIVAVVMGWGAYCFFFGFFFSFFIEVPLPIRYLLCGAPLRCCDLPDNRRAGSIRQVNVPVSDTNALVPAAFLLHDQTCAPSPSSSVVAPAV